MRADIFQTALLATARVACCAALLVACRPIEETKTPPNQTEKQADSQPEADSQPDAAKPMSLDECKSHTAAVFTAKTAAQNSETKACCAQVADSIDGKVDPKLTSTNWAERSECCGLLEWQGSMACTPWGPPCPPAMLA